MKKGAKIFVCGPSRKNNMEMKNFLRKVGVELGEGSAPFMEDELPQLFKKYFGILLSCLIVAQDLRLFQSF